MENFDLKKYLAEGKLLKEEQMGSYRKFLKVVKSYEDEEILSDFLDSYPKGQDISKSEYDKFTEKHLGLADPEDHRGENWKYIMSEGKLLKENAPGYDTRKFGESLPTLESVKAAYEAKKDNEEEPRDGVKSAAAKLGMKPNHIKEEDITETRDLSVKEKMDNILYVMDPVQVIDELILAMSTDDANLYLDAIIQDHGIMAIDEAKKEEEDEM